jgi:hypothetical protein
MDFTTRMILPIHTYKTGNKTFWNYTITSLYQEVSSYMIKGRYSKSLPLVTFEDISSVNQYKGQDHNDLILSYAIQNNKEDRNKCLPAGNQPTPSCSMIHGPHNYRIFWLRGSTQNYEGKHISHQAKTTCSYLHDLLTLRNLQCQHRGSLFKSSTLVTGSQVAIPDIEYHECGIRWERLLQDFFVWRTLKCSG